MSKKTRDHPVFLTGQDFLDGDVVFFDGSGWTRDFSKAALAIGSAEKERFERFRQVALASGEVVDLALIPVKEADDLRIPIDLRERIRILGPTVRNDLGKQADGLAGKIDHVPL